MVATVTMPRLLHIGAGAVAEIATVLRRLGVKVPLIVTDGFMVSSGTLAKVTDPLDRAGARRRVCP